MAVCVKFKSNTKENFTGSLEKQESNSFVLKKLLSCL
jgi:hypothetical protein